MSQWYYAGSAGTPQGPVEQSELAGLLRNGRIGPDTLCWREGMDQWAPLASLGAEAGLAFGGSEPPPLPVDPAGVRATAPNNPTIAPPRRGMGGCMIALVVVGVLAIPALAIVAAIAIPAYQDYVQRSHVAQALTAATPLQTVVVSRLQADDRCPVNTDPGFRPGDAYAGGNLAGVTLGEFEGGLCGLELVLRGTGNAGLDDKAIWLAYDPVAADWHCSSEIEDRYLPQRCRG